MQRANCSARTMQLLFFALWWLPLVASSCYFPARLWCSSAEIARQCNVERQCRPIFKGDAMVGPVNVELYFESECGGCKQFITTQLYPVWQKLGPTVLNVTLVPYGNAKEKKTIFGDWKFTCQHGEEECVGNLIETCAIALLKNVSSFFPFLHCIESVQYGVPAIEAPKCAKKLGLDYDPILTCANGKTGASLEHEMAVLTDSLEPKHTYVPWVVVNGVHTEAMNQKAMSNLLELVCQTYQGPTPKACQAERCYRDP